jgi:hypothetical protein
MFDQTKSFFILTSGAQGFQFFDKNGRTGLPIWSNSETKRPLGDCFGHIS